MKQIDVPLNEGYIELCKLLKLAGVAGSAGQGKHLVANGEVRLDGQLESRKTAKIHVGQTVTCLGVRIRVVAE